MIQEHLYDETHLEYSFAAIVRGLIDLGLIQVEGVPNLAVLFMGCRLKRGRKPGGKVSTAVVPLDLRQGDMDLEYEDIHNDALGPQPKKEVVARERTRRRRRPIRNVALLEADDEDTDPGMDLDDADTADGEPESS
ncbi:MAG: hypothetical protein ABI134_29675 [Byssovorax sp.]